MPSLEPVALSPLASSVVLIMLGVSQSGKYGLRPVCRWVLVLTLLEASRSVFRNYFWLLCLFIFIFFSLGEKYPVGLVFLSVSGP